MTIFESILRQVLRSRAKDYRKAWLQQDHTPSASIGDVREIERLTGRMLEIGDLAGILFGTEFKEELLKELREIT